MEIDLNNYKRNVYSQHGEDGIVGKIFDTLGIDKGFFVEFGAWDGKHLSNTYNLYERGWDGIYIECDEDRFEDLKRNIDRPSTKKLCQFVETAGENSIDTIVDRNATVSEVDVMSIDIDSSDLAIFASLERYLPKVVVIEYNPTIAVGVPFVNPPGTCSGSSITSILDEGARKGFRLVAQTSTNLILMRGDVFEGASFAEVSPVNHRCLFTGFDGTLYQYWNGQVECKPAYHVWGAYIFQPLPRFLQKYSRSPLFERVRLAWALLVPPIFDPRVVALLCRTLVKRLGSGETRAKSREQH